MTVTANIRVTTAIKEWLDETAERLGMTQADVIRKALQEAMALEEHGGHQQIAG